jgi:hypothetical protein
MYKGLSCWNNWNVPFARDACSGTESVLQQECEEDMFPWPHSDAISRQQAASSAVAAVPGSMQAKTGDPPRRPIKRKTPILVTCFTDLKSTKAVLLDASGASRSQGFWSQARRRKRLPLNSSVKTSSVSGPHFTCTFEPRVQVPSIHSSFARRRSCALMATMTVLSDMSAAPAAGERMMPFPARTPAASGIARRL